MLKKGMDILPGNQQKILSALKAKTEMSVDELTRKLGLAKTAVRRHLLVMEKRGLLESKTQTSTSRGRPRLTFRLTPESRRLFPSKEAELLSHLLRFLLKSGNENLVERFFEEYWQKRFDEIQKAIQKTGKDDMETRIAVLKEVLTREGFMPRLRVNKDSQLLLQECHCPLDAAAQVTSFPCQLEKRLITRVLKADVLATKMRSKDEDQCEYLLPLSKL